MPERPFAGDGGRPSNNDFEENSPAQRDEQSGDDEDEGNSSQKEDEVRS